MPSAAVAPINSLARMDIGRSAASACTACNCTSTLVIFTSSVTALNPRQLCTIPERLGHFCPSPAGSGAAENLVLPLYRIVPDSSSVSGEPDTYRGNCRFGRWQHAARDEKSERGLILELR